jgi:hypothetical protein
MKNQSLILAMMVFAGLSLAATGCIFGSDPNKNSTLFGAFDAGSTGGTTGGGTAGSTGNPCTGGPLNGTAVAVFDTTTEGFMLDGYHDTAQTNLNDATNPASPPPSLSFDGTQGVPSAGSLSVTAPYFGANQYVDVQKTYGATNLQNWMGKTLHVCIKVSQGVFKGGVQLYVKTGATFYFAGTYTTLAAGSNWQEFRLNVNAPMMIGPGTGTYDPAHVVSFGLQLNSSGAGTGSTPVTFNLDGFSIDPPVPAVVDSGTDTPAATDAPVAPDTAPAADTGSTADTAASVDTAAPADATDAADATGN